MYIMPDVLQRISRDTLVCLVIYADFFFARAYKCRKICHQGHLNNYKKSILKWQQKNVNYVMSDLLRKLD